VSFTHQLVDEGLTKKWQKFHIFAHFLFFCVELQKFRSFTKKWQKFTFWKIFCELVWSAQISVVSETFTLFLSFSSLFWDIEHFLWIVLFCFVYWMVAGRNMYHTTYNRPSTHFGTLAFIQSNNFIETSSLRCCLRGILKLRLIQKAAQPHIEWLIGSLKELNYPAVQTT